jgi:predicted dehydrogenase
MKFLIAGLGSIGKRHLQNLLALGERDIILYRTHKSTMSDDEINDLPVFTDLNLALQKCPDAVIVSNPTAVHMDVALPAARAGCHLFIEKPISHTLEGMENLRNTLKEKDRKTLVGFQFRFHPVLREVKDFLTTGFLGRPLSIHAHWGEYLPSWHPWEDYRKSYAARSNLGGGVAFTLCHPFDYLRWIVGEISEVSATTSKTSLLEIDVEDHVEATLHFTNGCLGTVHLDYFQQPGSHWLEISLENGIIHWDNFDSNAVVFDKNGKIIKRFVPPNDFERNHLFLSEMRQFIYLVYGREGICVSNLESGIKSLAVVLAIYESAARNNVRISLC